MKKTAIRIISLALVAIMLLSVLCSCATTLSGTYSGKADVFGLAGAEVTYKFSGSKVTVTSKANVLGFEKTTEYSGTYKIADSDDGKQTITFTFDGDASSFSGTSSFSMDKESGTIKIGGITYTKTK